MYIKPSDPALCPLLRDRLVAALAPSRFTAVVSCAHHDRWKSIVLVENIRLKQKKDYCGQHPGPCVLNFKKHRHGRWLEGQDWVAFNDGLNDILDGLAVSADVWTFNREMRQSGRYFIRRGLERRVDYLSSFSVSFARLIALWDRDGKHENCVGKEHPRSVCTDGTPGIYAWTSAEAQAQLTERDNDERDC